MRLSLDSSTVGKSREMGEHLSAAHQNGPESGASLEGFRSRFSTVSAISNLVKRFESGELSRAEWDHEAHLIVGAWYLTTLPEPLATERMTRGIRHLNHLHGVQSTRTSGYHETITLFWLTAIRAVLVKSTSGFESVLPRVEEVFTAYANRSDLIFDFYDQSTLFSEVARAHWISPTRLPGKDLEYLSSVFRGHRS